MWLQNDSMPGKNYVKVNWHDDGAVWRNRRDLTGAGPAPVHSVSTKPAAGPAAGRWQNREKIGLVDTGLTTTNRLFG